MNKLNFRKQDIDSVTKEHDCITTLQKEIANHIERGNYATAEICAEDMIASIKEIRKMRKAKRKQDHDFLMQKSKRLATQGIKTEVVAR